MNEDGAKHLLARVEEPDLDGSLGPLPPTLVDEGEQRQAAESKLDQQSERAKQLAIALIIVAAATGIGRGCHGRGCRGGESERRGEGGGEERGGHVEDGAAVGCGFHRGRIVVGDGRRKRKQESRYGMTDDGSGGFCHC